MALTTIQMSSTPFDSPLHVIARRRNAVQRRRPDPRARVIACHQVRRLLLHLDILRGDRRAMPRGVHLDINRAHRRDNLRLLGLAVTIYGGRAHLRMVRRRYLRQQHASERPARLEVRSTNPGSPIHRSPSQR